MLLVCWAGKKMQWKQEVKVHEMLFSFSNLRVKGGFEDVRHSETESQWLSVHILKDFSSLKTYEAA